MNASSDIHPRIPHTSQRKKVVLAPLDPVHDAGLKLIRRKLQERGHEVFLLPPDLSPEEIVARTKTIEPDFLMVSRAISYNTWEVMAKLVDLCDASGLRPRTKIVAGGLSMRPEMAQELGFDAGFGPDTPAEAAVAYVEGTTYAPRGSSRRSEKVDLTAGFSYQFRDREIGNLCMQIAENLIGWASRVTTPGIERAKLRLLMSEARSAGDLKSASELRHRYAGLCEGQVQKWYATGEPLPHTRPVSEEDAESLARLTQSRENVYPPSSELLSKHNVFVQYGTGCPIMDAHHISASLSFGARGVIHFDPSWGARTEGLLEGAWSHQHDGTLLTLENLELIKKALLAGSLWQVRAHRGLNTPETVVLAHLAGADLTKINIVYGSLGGGTDPARLSADGIECIRLASRFRLPFDVVTNEELCGVPARKAFAGMLVVATAGILLGGRPILQPLFANSPEAIISGLCDDNFIDFNLAKIQVLRDIIDAPIWPGAPVGFLTQTQDRCQSATMTALHAALAIKAGASAVTIASSDEAYAGGPITAAARVDTLQATAAALRFFGSAGIAPSPRSQRMADELRKGILETLSIAARRNDFVSCLYEGVFGDREDGAYPGQAGRNTVRTKQDG